MIKNILGRIFAFWALLVFVVTMLIFIFPAWLTKFIKTEPKRSAVFIDISRVWITMFFVLTGVRRKFVGREHFKNGENFIIVCNHNSFMDVPLTSPGIPGPNKTIAKDEMEKIPVFNIIYRGGSVLVNRKSEMSRKKSYLKMKEVLKLGMHMVIFAEGTRNKTKEPLQRFHDGAFRLAMDTRKPILPTVIFNTQKVLPLHKKFYFWPYPVEMHHLPPVSVTKNDSTESLKEKVHEIMKQYILSHKN
jgi:1-acyl-sn-glycerol-3-phosphate acyltransferase